jgi:hypothetical protein
LLIRVPGTSADSGSFSSLPRIRLHFASQDLVHVRLVLFPSPSKPVEYIGIDAKADQLLDRPVEPPDLNIGFPRRAFRRIGKVDLRIRPICETL